MMKKKNYISDQNCHNKSKLARQMRIETIILFEEFKLLTNKIIETKSNNMFIHAFAKKAGITSA
ncbi:hypothetical protein DNG35_08890 [Mesonia sp. K7]|nr:hypothetical protein DNG35_08890 [Mesonia sp. K7]